MNYQNKTKAELITELQRLRQNYDSLKESYSEDLTKIKQTEQLQSKNEKYYRSLFNEIDEGFCIVEVIFDKNEKPIDYRFLEINTSFEKQTGLIDAKGKRMRDLEPRHEEYWFEIYGKIALTGHPLRFENYAEELHRWFNVYAFRSGEPKMRHVAILFNDITERKIAEASLKESEERLRILIEHSGLGIGYFDIEGKILMFNNEALKNLGGRKSDYIGKNLIEFFGKETGQVYINRLKLAAASATPLYFEDRVEMEGRPGWYLSCHMRILNQDGEVDGIQVIANNISERKNYENLVNEKNANLAAIFENTNDLIASRDKNHCLVNFNTPFKHIFKKISGLEAVTGLCTLDYLSEEEKKNWVKILDYVLTGNSYKNEFSWDYGTGVVRFYDISVRPIIVNDEIIGTLEINRDITEYKMTESKMRTNALYSRNLIEASLDPFVTINAEGKIMDVNQSTEHITGVKRDKLIGTDFMDYFEDPEKAGKVYRAVFSEGMVKNYPLTIIRSDGLKTDVLYNATIFKNEDGNVQGVFAAARDITERKKTEEELRRSKKLLEKLNKHLVDIREDERNQIALNLHDDLGQQLTAINLNITWLKSRIGVQSKAVREKIEEISLTISESIESIREISSFLRPAILFDLGLVPAFMWQLKRFEQQSGIKCYFHHEPQELKINNSVSLILFRVLQESLTNVARHSGATEASIALQKAKNKIEMLIKDNGIGIDEEKISSPASMGIAGIKERVRSVHGNVIIKGEKGFWTFIKISIPVKTQKNHD